jgi:hypothetical protein
VNPAMNSSKRCLLNLSYFCFSSSRNAVTCSRSLARFRNSSSRFRYSLSTSRFGFAALSFSDRSLSNVLRSVYNMIPSSESTSVINSFFLNFESSSSLYVYNSCVDRSRVLGLRKGGWAGPSSTIASFPSVSEGAEESGTGSSSSSSSLKIVSAKIVYKEWTSPYSISSSLRESCSVRQCSIAFPFSAASFLVSFSSC